jgi:hypothetical protein
VTGKRRHGSSLSVPLGSSSNVASTIGHIPPALST